MDYRLKAFAGSSVDPARWRHPLYRAQVSGLFEVTDRSTDIGVLTSRI